MVSLYHTVAPRQVRTPADTIMKIRDGQVELDPKRIAYLYPRQSYDIPLPELPNSGYEPDDRPCFEVYRGNPTVDAKKGIFRCDLCLPVRPL